MTALVVAGATKPVPGAAADYAVWAAKVNACFDAIDRGIGQTASLATTGGTTTLSDAQNDCLVLRVTGTLVSNAILDVKARPKLWIIQNATAGAFTLTVQVVGGAGNDLTVEQGKSALVRTDGTDVFAILATDLMDADTPLPVANGGTGATTAAAAAEALGVGVTDTPTFAGVLATGAGSRQVRVLSTEASGVDGRMIANGATSLDVTVESAVPIVFKQTATVRASITAGGQIVGGDDEAWSVTGGTITPRIQANGGGGTASVGAMRWSADASGAYLVVAKSRNATFGSHTVLQNNDDIGYVAFDGSDGTAFRRAAEIFAEVEGTPGADEMPSRLTLSTRPTGAAAVLAPGIIIGADQRVRLGTKGTAALPVLTFDGDTNTGIYSHTDDDVSIATGGVRQWAVTAAGALVHTGGIDGAAPGGVALQLNNGLIDSQGTFDETGAASANLVVASGGVITKTSSSLRYKKDVETAEFERSAAIVDSIRPVWYRSRGRHDDPNDSFWGFIAEEVAEVDPRLVSYGHAPGTDPEIRRKTKPTVPDGVAYERFVVHLVATMQDARRRIAALEARVAELEAG